MGPQKQLRVVKRVKIIHRRPGAEPDALDLLQVDVKHPLRLRRLSAAADPVKGVL